MFDYAEMAELATELLKEFGRPEKLTLRNYPIPAYDVATGAPVAAVPPYSDTLRYCVIFDFGRGQTISAGGGLIQQGDRRCLMEPAGTVPALEDHVLNGATEYVIKAVGQINPAGTPVLYDLHLRS